MYGNIVAIYLKQKVIPRKTWSVSVTTLLLLFFTIFILVFTVHPLSLNDLSKNLAPLSASGVWKWLHAGWMSAIVHLLFINAYILKHFSPSHCRTDLTLLVWLIADIFHWTINESIKFLSPQRLVISYASEPCLCLVLIFFQGLSGLFISFFWNVENNEFIASFWRGKGLKMQFTAGLCVCFLFCIRQKNGVFEKH